MAQNFGDIRNVELSTIFYIETQLSSGWTGINVVKGYPNFPKQTLPCVAIRMNNILNPRREIGSRVTEDIYNFVIDIFATSDGQKLDIAQYLTTLITLNNWTFYTWSRGSGDTMDKSQNGKVVYLDMLQNAPVLHTDDVDTYERFRHVLSFDVKTAPNA